MVPWARYVDQPLKTTLRTKGQITTKDPPTRLRTPPDSFCRTLGQGLRRGALQAPQLAARPFLLPLLPRPFSHLLQHPPELLRLLQRGPTSTLTLVPAYQARVSSVSWGDAPADARRGGIASGPMVQFASVLVHAMNDGNLRPFPVDDFDRFCTPALFVQDGTGPFSGFVLAECPPGVDPHSTFVLTRVTGEDDVNAVVARSYSFGV
jgi:hypothetical protein